MFRNLIVLLAFVSITLSSTPVWAGYMSYISPQTTVDAGRKIDLVIPQINNSVHQDTINHLLKEHSQKVLQHYNNALVTYKEDDAARKKHFTLLSAYDVKMNTRKVLSVLHYSYMYVGGAHGNHFITTQNFNMQTGELLTLADLFTDDDYLEQLNDQVRKQLLFRYNDLIWFKGINDNTQNFLVSREGLFLVYPPYEIAPYASGTLTFFIPYSSLRKVDFSKIIY